MAVRVIFVVLAVSAVFAARRKSLPWNKINDPDWPSLSPWSAWIESDFEPTKPWTDTKCFHAWFNRRGQFRDPPNTFHPDLDCPLCGADDSIPGFTADPTDCSKFYMCFKAEDSWKAFGMQCAPCMFWNQQKLTCVSVQKGDRCREGTTSPLETPITSTTSPEPLTVEEEDRAFTCVTFDEGGGVVQGTRGAWVANNGVTIISERGVCKWQNCGYFNGSSSLHIPFFVNNYQSHKEFSVSFFYAVTGGSSYQGIVSNQCHGDVTAGCSICVTSPSHNLLNAGMKGPGNQTAEAKYDWGQDNNWHHVVMSWDGSKLLTYRDTYLIGSQKFKGPIRETTCPLVLGCSECPSGRCFFTGLMDQVCFYKTALNRSEINYIAGNPGWIYE